MTSHAESPVVFDLDGTLIDSRADLAAAVDRLRAELELPPLSRAEVVAQVGRGARDLVRRCLPQDVDGAPFEAAFLRFRNLYDEACLVETRLYPGLARLLENLAKDRPLAILTNKPEGTSRKILVGLGVAELFREIVGGDTLAARKPDPVGLHHLAARLAWPIRELTLVGDSAIDQATAHAAGARFVFVEWGFAAAPERALFMAAARAATTVALATVLAEPVASRP